MAKFSIMMFAGNCKELSMESWKMYKSILHDVASILKDHDWTAMDVKTGLNRRIDYIYLTHNLSINGLHIDQKNESFWVIPLHVASPRIRDAEHKEWIEWNSDNYREIKFNDFISDQDILNFMKNLKASVTPETEEETELEWKLFLEFYFDYLRHPSDESYVGSVDWKHGTIADRLHRCYTIRIRQDTYPIAGIALPCKFES